MTASASPAHPAQAPVTRSGEQYAAWGSTLMRLALGIIFLWFGAMKFTSYEATMIAPLITNSPLLVWMHGVFGIQGASNVIGVFEVATGALLLAGFVRPALSVVGGAMAVITFAVTLTFLATTPGVAEPLAGGFPALSAAPGQFLLKDLGLLGIAIFVLGESLLLARGRVRGDAGGALWARRPTARESDGSGARILRIATAVLRYGLALIFLWFGAMKFTSYEATGIAPFVMNSPLVGWWHSAFGIQGTSTLLGVFEIATGVFLLLAAVAPRLSVVGGVMATITFLITVTFFFTTPGVAAPIGFPAISVDVGQFLLKDIGLLGISIWLLGDAWACSAKGSVR